MKRLLLLRHAKATWKNPLQEDHDRALTGRGRNAAEVMGHEMAKQGLNPDFALCSTARRTTETLAQVIPALGPLRAQFDKILYEASAETLLEQIRRLPARLSCVLLVGHNPSLEELAHSLCSNPGSNAARRLNAKFPTAALAVFKHEEEWKNLKFKNAHLEAFLTPRNLQGEKE